MNKKLVDSLRQDFPRVFRGGGGVECGDGWEPLIRRLCEKLEPMTAGEDGLYATQIKEKFGRLRFCIGTGSDAAYDAIDAAETESGSICENCGESGRTVDSHGWLQTLCRGCE